MSDSTTVGDLIHIGVGAKQLGLSEYQVRGLVERGELAATKVGRRTYLLASSIEDYLARIRGRAS